jgi:flagellar biosynthesis/type III secretory pathway protein FliH
MSDKPSKWAMARAREHIHAGMARQFVAAHSYEEDVIKLARLLDQARAEGIEEGRREGLKEALRALDTAFVYYADARANQARAARRIQALLARKGDP